jgi:hypothetical protein
MGVFDGLRARAARRPVQLIGRIADDPQFVSEDGGLRYMSFHLEEVPGREFRIKMLPTTPKRRKGDRLDLSYRDGPDGIAWVDMMTGAPDAEASRRRNQEYLANVEANGAPK